MVIGAARTGLQALQALGEESRAEVLEGGGRSVKQLERK